MMTRRDFNALAAALAAFRTRMWLDLSFDNTYDEKVYERALQTLSSSMADLCAASNPRFDRPRFLRAALGDEL